MKENKTEPSTPYEAVNYIESYYRFIGIDPSEIDWSKRPAHLPDDVNKAWDIIEADQEEYEEAAARGQFI